MKFYETLTLFEDNSEKVHKGYRRDELLQAFRWVVGSEDWRGPIERRIMKSDLRVVRAAIEFYTATDVFVTGHTGTPYVTVESAGYRNGPAGS